MQKVENMQEQVRSESGRSAGSGELSKEASHQRETTGKGKSVGAVRRTIAREESKGRARSCRRSDPAADVLRPVFPLQDFVLVADSAAADVAALRQGQEEILLAGEALASLLGSVGGGRWEERAKT